MAGLYLHIPFCKQRCSYCDFHFSTSSNQKDKMLEAIKQELIERKEELKNQRFKTIYLGGGTPSLLTPEQIKTLIDCIYEHYPLEKELEITLEANPDDLSLDYLISLKNQTPINRLSIGLQSFEDEELVFMNRAHHQTQSLECIENAQKVGFENLSVDLIYGTPGTNTQKWRNALKKVMEFKIPHISAYALTVEEKTPLNTWIKQKKTASPNQDLQLEHFKILREELQKNGYLAYEISNYCLPGFASKHNSNYWKGIPYLGFGPSAHSYDGKTRSWNVSNNSLYIKAVESKKRDFQRETLSNTQKANEKIMIGLRSIQGVDLEELWTLLNPKQKVELEKEIDKNQTLLEIKNGRLIAKEEALFLLDKICVDLFLDS
ncbi:MAG: coproporphyrinogen III oxidase [Flavobacteriaceae bacterium]|nr:MAG: coproporphyrinogen III oxidase [Flavobacteriaceae bacterium]